MFDFLLGPAPWMALPLLLLGFLPLIKGADWLVDGASALAARLNIPALVIGLTIVAFGTSAPELAVNLFAGSAGSTDLALGNIIGSNIFNVVAILGLSALIYPLAIQRSTAWAEIPLSLMAAVTVLVLAADSFLEGAAGSALGRIDGLVLLLFFVIFLFYNYNLAKKGGAVEDLSIKPYTLGVSLLWILLGLAALVLGGRMIVDGAVRAATDLGIPERIIGLTIVSIGTSLPELATSLVAARKKNTDIAVGNIVGSNIFNIFLILGLTAVVQPVRVVSANFFDLAVNVGIGVLLWVFAYSNKKREIRAWHGIVFLGIYAAYLGALLFMPA